MKALKKNRSSLCLHKAGPMSACSMSLRQFALGAYAAPDATRPNCTIAPSVPRTSRLALATSRGLANTSLAVVVAVAGQNQGGEVGAYDTGHRPVLDIVLCWTSSCAGGTNQRPLNGACCFNTLEMLTDALASANKPVEVKRRNHRADNKWGKSCAPGQHFESQTGLPRGSQRPP